MPKKRKILFIILVLLVLLTVLGILYHFGFFNKLLKSATYNQTTNETSPQPTYSKFSGEFVTATTLEDWSIVEYKNGTGSTMLTSGLTYKGLTGLGVKNSQGTVVFKLEGVYGIGGAGGCTTYFKFDDDSSTYYNSIVSANAEVSSPAPTIVDLRGLPYSTIILFGTKMRRIGTNLYWDTDPAVTYFEAACGTQERIFTFSSPQFTISGPQITPETLGNYQFEVPKTVTAGDLIKLDAVLNSLKVK